MKKKILIIANNSGGLYQFRKELIETLILKGNQVYASIPEDDYFEELKEIGVKIVKTDIDRRGMNPVKDLGVIKNYCKIIKEVNPDQIITYTIKPNLYGGMIAGFKQIPYAINITGLGTTFQKEGMFKKVIVLFYKIACRKAKTVFFENSGNAQIFRDLKIVDENQICILNGAGVNLEKFHYSEYPKESSHTHFLFIGRIMKEKGVGELFDVIERIHKEDNSVVLDVLGYMEEEHDRRVKELVEQGAVIYHGHQDDVRPYIEKSHCFVLPSYHEGMANTNLECASMGRPLITSRIHGCMEAVVEGKSGLLCEKQDAEDLYQKMKEFIEMPYEERKAMGQAGREHMENVFDKKKVVEETLDKVL